MTTTTAVRRTGPEHHAAVVAVLAPALPTSAIARPVSPGADLRELSTARDVEDRLRGISVTARHHRLAYLDVGPALDGNCLARTPLAYHHQRLHANGIPSHASVQNDSDLAVLASTGYESQRLTTAAAGSVGFAS